jgi:hypothetical protein
MSKPRVTDEERIVAWFVQAPLDSARVLFNIVKGVMRNKAGPPPARLLETSRRRVASKPDGPPRPEAPAP